MNSPERPGCWPAKWNGEGRRRHWIRVPKIKYATEREAIAALHLPQLRAYRCGSCGLWHVSSKPTPPQEERTMTEATMTTPLSHTIHTHGHVVLDDHMGNDLAIVNNARVSFNDDSAALDERDAGLIGFLMRNRHGSPFEAGSSRCGS